MKVDPEKIPLAASADALAALLDLSPRRVRQIAAEGRIKALSRGLWPVALIVQAAVAAAGRARDGDAERNARAALMRARAREIEVRIAEREKELVPTEEAIAYTQAVIGALISRMNGLPAQITRDLDERRRIETMFDAIRTEVAAVCAECEPVFESWPNLPEVDE